MKEEREITPTDIEYERSRGRVAVFLTPADALWLSRHCFLDENSTEEDLETAARIQFRSRTAVHKAGLIEEP